MKVYKYDQSDKEKAASKRGRASHAKGDYGEQWMCEYIQERLDKSGLAEFFAVISKKQNKGDKFLPEVGVVPRWDFFDHIIHGECKWRKNLNVYKAYEQALNASKVGALLTVFQRRPWQPILTTQELDDWWELFELYLWCRLAQEKGLDVLKQCPFFD